MLPPVRKATFGPAWVGLTFLFFSPVIFYTVRLFIDLLTSVLARSSQ